MRLDTERMTPGEIKHNLEQQAQLKDKMYLALLEERWARAKQLAKECKRLQDQLAAHYASQRRFRPPE